MELLKPLEISSTTVRTTKERALGTAADELELFVRQLRDNPAEMDRLAEHFIKRLQIIRKELALAALRSGEPETVTALSYENV